MATDLNSSGIPPAQNDTPTVFKTVLSSVLGAVAGSVPGALMSMLSKEGGHAKRWAGHVTMVGGMIGAMVGHDASHRETQAREAIKEEKSRRER